MRGVSLPVLLTLFLMSGSTGLVYELVWTRQLVFVFGGTTHAVTTVLVAFLGGLGLGSYLAGRFADRVQQPGRMYGILEVIIGLYALAVPLLIGLTEPIYRAVYPSVEQAPTVLTALRFVLGCMVFLLPATLMGATLPLLVRYVTLTGGRFGEKIAILYGTNSMGAVCGTLLAGLVLIPTLGLSTTTLIAAAVNITVGLAAVVLLRLWRASDDARTSAASGDEPDVDESVALTGATRRLVLIVFAVSGFVAMVYQITWTRALVLSIGSSTYAFTCILAAFILGIAIGSLTVSRRIDQWRNPVLVFGVIQVFIGAAAVVILPLYGQIPQLMRLLFDLARGNFQTLLLAEFALIIAVTFIPTFLMGAAFPLVTKMLAAGRLDAAAATGRAYAINTIGTILGSAVAGFILIRSWPHGLGAEYSILAAALVNTLAGLTLIAHSTSGWSGAGAPWRLVGLGAAALIPLTVWVGGRWDPIVMNAGAFYAHINVEKMQRELKLVYFAEGVDLNVAVMQDRNEAQNMTLHVNGKPDASTNYQDMATMLLVGHVPALFAPSADNVCVVGLGAGLTLGSIVVHDHVKQVDCIEISDEVINAAKQFNDFAQGAVDGHPKVTMIPADGRNHLLLTDRTYDVIVSQPSNPWMAGVANLFTREYFTLVRDRLRDDGVACIWMQGYAMGKENFRIVARTLAEVFPHISVWEGNRNDYLFLVTKRPLRMDLDKLTERMRVPAVRSDLYRVSLGRADRLLAHYVTGDAALRRWAASAPVHTDDNALLEFSSPQFVYAGEPLLIAGEVLALRSDVFADLVDAPAWKPETQDLKERIAKLHASRNVRHEADVKVAAGADLALVLEDLVAAARSVPGSYADYSDVVRVRQQLENSLSTAPAIRAAIDRAAAVPFPTVTDRTGRTLHTLTDTLNKLAAEAASRRDWPTALHYLSEIEDAAPDFGPSRLLRLEILAQTGRTEEAFAMLRDEVSSGRIPASVLQQPQALRSMRNDPRFAEALALVPASQPAVPPPASP